MSDYSQNFCIRVPPEVHRPPLTTDSDYRDGEIDDPLETLPGQWRFMSTTNYLCQRQRTPHLHNLKCLDANLFHVDLREWATKHIVECDALAAGLLKSPFSTVFFGDRKALRVSTRLFSNFRTVFPVPLTPKLAGWRFSSRWWPIAASIHILLLPTQQTGCRDRGHWGRPFCPSSSSPSFIPQAGCPLGQCDTSH